MSAWQAGYFPEHSERPDINDLLDAVRDDHSGIARYSMHDQDAAQAYRDALDRNVEIDRLASEHDLPTTGITHAQFMDRLADILSQHEMAAEIKPCEADLIGTDMAYATAAAAENPEYGAIDPRSLEALEDEYRQERGC